MSMVFLQNKCKVRGSTIGVEDYPIIKLAYNTWIKNIMVICAPLILSMNRCVLSDVLKK
jgi:hypothetical protein